MRYFEKVKQERIALVKKRFDVFLAELEFELGLTRERIIEYALHEETEVKR